MKPIICFITFLLIESIWNWYIIVVNKRSPDHLIRTVFRSLVFLALSLIFYSFPSWLICWGAFHLAFWFPFDVTLNLLRGRAWDYIGETSWLDRLGRQWPGAFVPGKLLLCIMGFGFLTLL